MSGSPFLLQAEAIDKSFPGVHALDRVDFDLKEGEVHVLLAENGAGIMGALGNGLNLLNVSAFWQRVIMGMVIIFVVIFDQWRRRRFGA